jgi:hypothetical protein
MIIQIESHTAERLATATADLRSLAQAWGYQTAEAPTGGSGGTHKTIDPIAVASLVLSIPAAALAVADLVDRIHKRRRAQDLIDRSQQLATQQVTLYVILEDSALPLATLTPDQLLDLQASQPPDDENTTDVWTQG